MNATHKSHPDAEMPPLTRVFPPIEDPLFALGKVILTWGAFEAIRDAHQLLDVLLGPHVLGEGSDIRDTDHGLRVATLIDLPTGVKLQVVTQTSPDATTHVRIVQA